MVDAEIEDWKEARHAEREGGFIPIILLVILGVSVGFVVGVKVQDKIVHDTEICHTPGPLMSTNERPNFPWPSMSVPTTAASTVEILDLGSDSPTAGE